MCKQLEISRAAYYKWLHRELPEQELENIKLAKLINELKNIKRNSVHRKTTAHFVRSFISTSF